MRRANAKKKATAGAWFYFCCLGVGAGIGILGTSFFGARTPKPDHVAGMLEAPGVVSWYTLSKVSFVERDGKTLLQFGTGIQALDGTRLSPPCVIRSPCCCAAPAGAS